MRPPFPGSFVRPDGATGSRRRRWFLCCALALLATAVSFLGSATQGFAGALATETVCGGNNLPVQTARGTECDYYPGETGNFTVPPGVTSLHVVAKGAAGWPGEGGADYDTVDSKPFRTPAARGGNGETIEGDYPVVAAGSARPTNGVAAGDQLLVNVGSGNYHGGPGGSGTHFFVIACGVAIPTDQPITAGDGGRGGDAAVLANSSAAGQSSLWIVAAGGGGGGGSSTGSHIGAFGGVDGTQGGDGGDAPGPNTSGRSVPGFAGTNDSIFGGVVGACPNANGVGHVTHGCTGFDGLNGDTGTGVGGNAGHIWAGGGGGGGGQFGGGAGQAGHWTCTDPLNDFTCTNIQNAGAGGGAGANVVPQGATTSANTSTDAFLSIRWQGGLTVAVNLTPSTPDGANGWYRNPPQISVTGDDSLGNPIGTYCLLDPATPPTTIADFAGLPSGSCDMSELTAAAADGHHTLYAISSRDLGVTSGVIRATWQLDTTPPNLCFFTCGFGFDPNGLFKNPDGSYRADYVLSFGCGDATSGIDPATPCPPSQTLHYADDTSATSTAVSVRDFAGHVSSLGPLTIRFEKGTPDDAVLYGACGGPLLPCSNLTIQEGGAVSLAGYVDAPSNDDGTLSIDWGDGTPATTASYPCAPADTSCPFTPGGLGLPSGRGISFEFDHTYANNPKVVPPTYTITVTGTEPGVTGQSTETTQATVTNAAPSVSLEPECGGPQLPCSTLTSTVGHAAVLAGRIADPGTDSGSGRIDWGDGSASTTVPFGCGTTGQPCPAPSQSSACTGPDLSSCGYFLRQHTYTRGGTFTISVTATDQDGDSSAPATTSADIASRPLVSSQPSNVKVDTGHIAAFGASADGTPAPTVQWQVSTDGGATFTDIPGATDTSYSFTGVQSMTGNEYRAVFTNRAGSDISAAATLTVFTPPAITTQPTDTTVADGGTAMFTTAASGIPAPTVQWLVSTNGPGGPFSSIPGATSTTLSFPATLADSGKVYVAIFRNGSPSGPVTTDTATLTVIPGLAITSKPSDQSVLAGQTTSFTAAAAGAQPFDVRWQVSTDGGATFTPVNQQFVLNLLPNGVSTTLSFPAAQSMSGNRYRAVFTNPTGSAATDAATLTVRTPPSITTQPADNDVLVGQTATFTAGASGTPGPTVQWQVSTGGGAFADVLGATSTTLSFVTSLSQSGNRYQAVFTNSAGHATTNAATLTVRKDTTPPVFTQQANINVPAASLAGAVVTYTVSASDPDDAPGQLTILCAPAPGSTFPLGANGATRTTTVTCDAHDATGNNATPMSFTVTVLGGHDQIGGVEAAVDAAMSVPMPVRHDLDQQLQKADQELARVANPSPKAPPGDAFSHYVKALGDLDQFVHRVSDNTTRTGHLDKPISPALAASLIAAALQLEKLCAPTDYPALDQLVALDGQVYLSPDLAAGQQDGLRYNLAGLLLNAETSFLRAEQALANGGPHPQQMADQRFAQAQQQLTQFVQTVQQNTKTSQHPNRPISPSTSTALVAAAQQASATIGALIH